MKLAVQDETTIINHAFVYVIQCDCNIITEALEPFLVDFELAFWQQRMELLQEFYVHKPKI